MTNTTKIFLIVVIFALLFSSLAWYEHTRRLTITEIDMDSNIIKTDNYQGAILTINGEDNWIPDGKIINEFETKLAPYIEYSSYLKMFSEDGKSLSYVKKNIKKYKRQYVGRLTNGRKILHCNFILVKGIDDNVFGDWTKRYIAVKDGGANFFNISYDIEKKELFDFYINGEA